MINVIITGPQGSGKSTLATMLCHAMLNAGYPLPKTQIDEGLPITTFRNYGNITGPWSIETRLANEAGEHRVKADLARLFYFLSLREESDGGSEVRPIYVACSRSAHLKELSDILTRLEAWTKA